MNSRQPDFSAPRGYARTMFSAWWRDQANRRDQDRRRFSAAAGMSILIHALLLLTTVQLHRENVTQPAAEPPPLVVRLVRPAAAPAAQAVEVTPVPPKARPPQTRQPHAPAKKPERPLLPARPAHVEKLPPQQAETAALTDMMSMVQAARERRRVAEEAAARANAEARASQAASADDIAMQNIRRSLQAARNDGANGVFQVLSKGARTGSFVFRGWTPGSRGVSQQTFEVDAGSGGDVERALVRKMIELIRKHYSGDFNWESQRLGTVLVLSARPEDNAALEAFLLREFFGDEGAPRK